MSIPRTGEKPPAKPPRAALPAERGLQDKCDPGGSPLCDLIWNTHGIIRSRFRAEQQVGFCQMPPASSSTLLWLRAVHGKSWLALLSCGRRGWLRQLTNQLTRFCAVMCPRSPVQFASGPARSLASMNRCADGPFRGHVSEPSSTKAVRSGNNRSYMSVSVGGIGTEMVGGGRCLGSLVRAGLLSTSTAPQVLYVVYHEARTQAIFPRR